MNFASEPQKKFLTYPFMFPQCIIQVIHRDYFMGASMFAHNSSVHSPRIHAVLTANERALLKAVALLIEFYMSVFTVNQANEDFYVSCFISK